MSSEQGGSSQPISLPKGGGALQGIGEKFSPDLHTGTGNFTVPIALPPGRNGFQPELNLVYSTGNGNGPFGLGWSLSIPGVSRKTSGGVPRYNEAPVDLPQGEGRDVFILSGAEDLVPVRGIYPDPVEYRPRTEGLFARITHHRGETVQDNFWKVESKDGLVSTYGLPASPGVGAAVITKPEDYSRIFTWKLTETRDTFGNLIRYYYEPDKAKADEQDTHRWDQPLISRIRYVDYGETDAPKFLVKVDFKYEDRPDPFSDYRAGFEIRTTKRCRSIKVSIKTADGQLYIVRKYLFIYVTDPYNGISLLRQLNIIGYDDEGRAYDSEDSESKYRKQLPPLTFGYTSFEPEKREFEVVSDRNLPGHALGAPNMELVDLHGSGLPDILEMNGVVRYWRNLGNGRFDIPRPMREAPPHSLADPGVQMIDANGDGRMDLLVTSGPLAGYYPLSHNAAWDRKSFQMYRDAPSFNLDDPEVKLVDLDGDGYTDILRSGTRLECFFNNPDPRQAWQRTNFVPRRALEAFPNVNFSDPRVKLADMIGDGLQDIVLIHDGNVEYWPNLGHGNWGRRITMRHGPRFPYGYDPRRILLGDVDGDGLADLVYVDHGKVCLWINQSGNSWTKHEERVEITGTPSVTDMDTVRLVDLHGTGVSGVLWSSDVTALSRHRMMFLDFTGGRKPYVLNEMNNHMGAVTRVEYRPSTYYYLEDEKSFRTRWRTPLPFPVQVVANVEVVDEISRGKLTTEYRYHHGYWDGAEREFRGFGMVEQLDTEAFDDYNRHNLHGDKVDFHNFISEDRQKHFSPPTLTKTWFHQGPVGEEFGDWEEVDYTHEYWRVDPQLLGHTEQVNAFLARFNDRGAGMPSPRNRRIKRDALRTLRGSILRTELYALDGDSRTIGGQEVRERTYTVTEHAYDLEEIAPPMGTSNPDRKRIFFPHLIAQRTTQWERGEDPMTQFTFTGYRYQDESNQAQLDPFGRPLKQTSVAMPRLARHQNNITGAIVGSFNPNQTRVLATHIRTDYAAPEEDVYIHDRVAQVKSYELTGPPTGPDGLLDDLQAALRKQWEQAKEVRDRLDGLASDDVRIIGHQVNHYDGPDFEGLAVGWLEAHGALTRTEALVFTDGLLHESYGDRRPVYLDGAAGLPGNAPSDFGDNTGYRPATRNAEGHVDGYYADTLRQRFSPRGLVLATQDTLRHETVIHYDDHDLLPDQVLDSAGLKTIADYNYRLLQPASVTDPNGNSTHIRYSPIGLPLKQFVSGLAADGTETLGGTEAQPEFTFDYNFLHFEETKRESGRGLPIFVHTARRTHHASDNVSDETIQSYEYSDGYGRLIQTRAQAEEVVCGELGEEVGLPPEPASAPAPAVGVRVGDRVVVSGWEVFDNKGQVVEKYEPFFSRGWDFQPEQEAQKGQHATLFYDPRGQVVRTVNPDGSEQRVILGRPIDPTRLEIAPGDIGAVPSGFDPTPWESYTYDPNDLAKVSSDAGVHSLVSRAPEEHYFTPGSVVMDALGRSICQIARNGHEPSGDWYITQSTYDIRGNLLTVADALGREAFKYRYDLLDHALAVDSIDAGLHTSVFDALGNLNEYRDSKGSLVLRTYDELNRPRQLWARNDSSGRFTLREAMCYGDDGDHSLARPHNSLGRAVKHYDEAGLLEMPNYDFKGNLLEKFRRTIRDDQLTNHDWLTDWSVSQDEAESALEPISYQTNTRYDALNRPTEVTYPLDVEGGRKALTPRYNRAGALEAVALGSDNYVEHIAYNAKGQRVFIAYGNNILTRYVYDKHTFRLVRMRTERFTQPGGEPLVFQSNGLLLQDFTYTYDLVGNITTLVDNAPKSGFLHGPGSEGPDKLTRQFSYDPIYRLLSATGRTCRNTAAPRGLDDDPRCGFYSGGAPTPNGENAPSLTKGYTERYRYDPAGNMLVHLRSKTTVV